MDPNFSPNGDSVVYETYFDDESRLEISRIDGAGRSARIPVTLSGTVALRPVFSPDGEKVAYADYDNLDDSKGQQIYTVNRNGSGNTQITDVDLGQGFVNRQPDWQPLP